MSAKPKVRDIQRRIATAAGFSVDELLSRRRAPRDLVKARFLAAWLARYHRPEMTDAQIARLFNRDRTAFRHEAERGRQIFEMGGYVGE